jgi:hypothetical protein
MQAQRGSRASSSRVPTPAPPPAPPPPPQKQGQTQRYPSIATKLEAFEAPSPDSANVIATEIEVSQRWAVHQRSCEALCPSISDLIAAEIKVSQRSALVSLPPPYLIIVFPILYPNHRASTHELRVCRQMRQAREMTALEQTDVPALVNQERADGDGLQNTSEFRADLLFSMMVGDGPFVSELDAIDGERLQNMETRDKKRKHSYSY